METEMKLSNLLAFPYHWMNQSKEIEEVILLENEPEYEMIKSRLEGIFLEGLKRITRVQNRFLYYRYMIRRLEYESLGITFTEREIFHATGEKNIPSILKDNLDYRKVKRYRYGKGVSFSASPVYANKECSKKIGIKKSMIIAKVLVGNQCNGWYPTRFPPKGYDTTGKGNKVIVKYYDDEFYPEYVAYYDDLTAKNVEKQEQIKQNTTPKTKQKKQSVDIQQLKKSTLLESKKQVDKNKNVTLPKLSKQEITVLKNTSNSKREPTKQANANIPISKKQVSIKNKQVKKDVALAEINKKRKKEQKGGPTKQVKKQIEQDTNIPIKNVLSKTNQKRQVSAENKQVKIDVPLGKTSKKRKRKQRSGTKNQIKKDEQISQDANIPIENAFSLLTLSKTIQENKQIKVDVPLKEIKKKRKRKPRSRPKKRVKTDEQIKQDANIPIENAFLISILSKTIQENKQIKIDVPLEIIKKKRERKPRSRPTKPIKQHVNIPIENAFSLSTLSKTIQENKQTKIDVPLEIIKKKRERKPRSRPTKRVKKDANIPIENAFSLSTLSKTIQEHKQIEMEIPLEKIEKKRRGKPRSKQTKQDANNPIENEFSLLTLSKTMQEKQGSVENKQIKIDVSSSERRNSRPTKQVKKDEQVEQDANILIKNTPLLLFPKTNAEQLESAESKKIVEDVPLIITNMNEKGEEKDVPKPLGKNLFYPKKLTKRRRTM